MNGSIPLYVIVLMVLASACLVVCLVCAYGPLLTNAWRKATALGRTGFFVAIGLLFAYAGPKPSPPPTGLGLHAPVPAVPVATNGWRLVSVTTNAAPDYARPAGAHRHEPWFAHGAYEAWCRLDLAPFAFPIDDGKVSSFAVFTDGKLRPTPRDTAHELGCGTRPMLCLQGASELWYGTSHGGSRLVTWKDFHPDANTNLTASLQIELFPSGNYTVRSNKLVFAYERIDPDDWDDDGIPNDLDGDPLLCDGDFFGPDPTQPATANSNAYCFVSIVATGPNAEITFTGDAPSGYPDPHFIARSGVTNRVPLLIGKTYVISANEPIAVFDASDPETEISANDDGSFTVVRPVYIYPSNGLHAFEMTVEPDNLGGFFTWTHSCCDILEEGGPLAFSFDCNRCRCPGCTAEGYYEYECYQVEVWGGDCWGHDDDDDNDAADGARLDLPPYVFVNNDNDRETAEDDLRPAAFSLPSPRYCAENGQVTVACTRGADRIRLWRNDDRTGPFSLSQSYDPDDTQGGTFYVEGVKVSETPDDVTFTMTWTDNNGRPQTLTRHTTVAFVTNVLVSSQYAIASGNPPPFAGQRVWTFDPQNSTAVDKHLVIPFVNVADTNDFSAIDFDIDFELEVLPRGFSAGDASWYPIGETPASGFFSQVSGKTATYANPKVGGVYRFGVTYGGSPESQCTVVLPLAGADVTPIVENDIRRVLETLTQADLILPQNDLLVAAVGAYCLATPLTANYRGRADNADHRTVWKYNGVQTGYGLRGWWNRGDGSVATFMGLPVRIAKLTNFLAGYMAELLTTNDTYHAIGQMFGNANDFSAQDSWDSGRDLARTDAGFVTTAETLAERLWESHDSKTDVLWPNENAVDNYQAVAPFSTPWELIDYDNYFYSPFFLNGFGNAFRDAYDEICEEDDNKTNKGHTP